MLATLPVALEVRAVEEAYVRSAGQRYFDDISALLVTEIELEKVHRVIVPPAGDGVDCERLDCVE